VRIGVDLGGTKIEALALADDGTAPGSHRVATPVGDYAATLGAIAELVAAVEGEIGVTATVGIGSPGSTSARTGLIRNANSTVLNGKPLLSDLAERLGRPVRLANDADCFALSEAIDGAGAGERVVFGAILGTGVGGGVVVDGQLVTGPNGIAGEWGHNPLPWPGDDERPGRACYCGKRGCIETWLSGPGFAADHAANGGRTLAPPAIVAAALAGDVVAEAALCRYEDRLARALAQVVNVIDPGAIVLGGGLSAMARLYANVAALLPRYVFSDFVATPLLPPRHGAASGVRGAARLWPATARPSAGATAC
jgi:fructokinase